jgi:peptidoglycan hydrolase-like protein with peptidoglycan-binding domain
MDKKTFAGIFVLTILIFAAGCKERVLEPTVTVPVTEEMSSGAVTTTLQPQAAPAEAQPQTQETALQISGQAQEPVSHAESIPPSEKEIQQALANAGLYDGAIDGKIGPKTEKAVEEFQTRNNLKVDGKVGDKTWAKLKEYLTLSPAPSSSGIKD